jgi:hypothetical protein
MEERIRAATVEADDLRVALRGQKGVIATMVLMHLLF